MVGVVEGARWSLYGAGSSPNELVAASTAAAIVLLVSGAYYFKRMEKTFADVL
jgi:lipopolysaccharide transport system permease protein